jgi:hypothetical protein
MHLSRGRRKWSRSRSRLIGASWLFLASASFGLFAGCGSPRPNQNVPAPLPDTPEGKLERVMQRLRSALEIAQGAAGSGIVSERTSSHKLIRPSDGSSNYKAEITIYTKIAVAKITQPAPPKNQNATPKEKGPAIADLDKPQINEKVEPLVEKKTFVLLYDGKRWNLEKEPEGEAERLIFKHALEDQP